MGLLGQVLSAAEFLGATRYLARAGRSLAQFFEGWDVLLTPTVAEPTPPTGLLQPTSRERRLLELVGALHAGRVLRLAGGLEELAAKAFEFTPKGSTLSGGVLGSTQSLVVGIVIVFTLLFLLLAGGNHFTGKLVKVLPSVRDKKVALSNTRETERSVSALSMAMRRSPSSTTSLAPFRAAPAATWTRVTR